jgi:hypothetical protein
MKTFDLYKEQVECLIDSMFGLRLHTEIKDTFNIVDELAELDVKIMRAVRENNWESISINLTDNEIKIISIAIKRSITEHLEKKLIGLNPDVIRLNNLTKLDSIFS